MTYAKEVSERIRRFMYAPKQPLILSLDTAAPEQGSVAVMRGTRCLALRRSEGRRVSHAISLLSDVDATLHAAGASLREIEFIATTIGPGSFTGLRTGLATVKAFAATLGRPCGGVSTLYAVAYAATSQEAPPTVPTLALLPAGRGEVFAQLLSVTAKDIRELAAPTHLPLNILMKQISLMNTSIRWAGADRLAAQIKEYARDAGIAIVDEVTGSAEEEVTGRGVWMLATTTAMLAEAAAWLVLLNNAGRKIGEMVNAQELQANYVRSSDAELKRSYC